MIELYGLNLVEESDDVYAMPEVPEELRIKTHYESLDIAGSSKIHYLKFTLPDSLPDLDQQLQEQLKNEEQAD